MNERRSVWLMTDILQSVRRFVKQREGARDKENRAKKRKVILNLDCCE
jgi:hypothetical protein